MTIKLLNLIKKTWNNSGNTEYEALFKTNKSYHLILNPVDKEMNQNKDTRRGKVLVKSLCAYCVCFIEYDS